MQHAPQHYPVLDYTTKRTRVVRMALAALLLASCSPIITHAQTIPTVITAIVTALKPLVTIAFGIGFLVFIWSVATFVRASGTDEDLSSSRKRIMWSVFGLFLLASLWGIVAVVQTLIGVDSTTVTCESPSIETSGSTVTVDTCL